MIVDLRFREGGGRPGTTAGGSRGAGNELAREAWKGLHWLIKYNK